MLFPPGIDGQFVTGAAAGLGHAFGQRLVPWVTRSWSRLFGGEPAKNAASLQNASAQKVAAQFESLEPAEMSGDSDFDELVTELAQIKSHQDWTRLVDSLKAAGMPIDPTTTERLNSIRNSVLAHQVPAPVGVRQLAELTADAFQRAGIERRDLEDWQILSDKLGDLPGEAERPISGPAAVAVATLKRPRTWFIWSREEVDRRQLLFTRRTVKNCRFACEQALTQLSDVSASRRVRELKEQLTLTEELLATVPPLNPPRSAMRVERQVAKQLVAAYAEAVKTTEELVRHTDNLLNLSPSSSGWSQEFEACHRAAARLTQMVRDRRSVR